VLWILATLVAAGAQTARNAMQSTLTASLGTLGATQVRFVYGLPFAAAFLALAAAVAGSGVPEPTVTFLAYTAGGATAQIVGTALLLAAMQARSFAVATTFNKTEAVQVAIFGVALLGEHLTLAGAAAIFVATAGVVLVAAKPGLKLRGSGMRPVVYGIASGGCFAIASVGFRGGILELGSDAYYLRAAATLVCALAFQAVLLGLWMALFARRALLASLALWRQSLVAGFFGAFASQFWFLGFSLTAAANVKALGLVEVVFAQVVAHRVFAQRATAREAAGMALVVAGVALLLLEL
jgi:drug/metabolite transporter (DMT)-like permease